MEKPPEIVDANFGKLSLVDESAYVAEVSWNREIDIQLIVHIDRKGHQRCIESAWRVFSAVRKNEMELLRQGYDAFFDHEWFDEFLYNEAMKTTIEIFPNGEGALWYYVGFLGNLRVEFSRDAVYMGAWGAPC